MKTKFAQVKSLLEPVESHSVIKEIWIVQIPNKYSSSAYFICEVGTGCTTTTRQIHEARQ